MGWIYKISLNLKVELWWVDELEEKTACDEF